MAGFQLTGSVGTTGGVNADAVSAAVKAMNAALESSRSPFRGFTDALSGLAAAQQAALKPFRDLRDTFQAAAGPAVGMARAVAGLPGAVAGFAASAGAAVARLAREPMQLLGTAVGAIQSQVAQFVGKLNPAAAQRFSVAVDDLYASIGRSLLPIMERFTQVVRVVGSMFNGLNGSGQKTVQVLASAAVGMTVFAAGAMLVQAAVTGGIGPLLGAVAGALGGVAFASGALDKVMKPLAATVGGALERVGSVLDTFTGSDAFAAMATAFGDLIGAAVEVGAQFAEGLMPAFNALAGVVKALMPAVTALLPLAVMLNPTVVIVQALAEAFASVGPVIESFAGVVTAVARAVTPVVSALMPLAVALNPVVIVVKLVAAQFELMAPVLVTIAEVVSDVVTRMADLVRSFLALLGVRIPTTEARKSELKDPTGMAARQAQTGGIEDVLKRARESAYSLGTGADQKTDPVVNQLSVVNTSIGALKKEAVDAIKGLPAQLAAAMLNRAGSAAAGAAAGVARAAVPGLAIAERVTGVNVGDLASRAVDTIRRGVPDAVNAVAGGLFGRGW